MFIVRHTELVMVTTRYRTFHRAAPTLDGQVLVPVRTSAGTPRFIPGADAWPWCRELVPWGLLDIDDPDEFTARYRERLDAVGVERIAGRPRAISDEHDGRPLALLCFEDVAAGQFCHRRVWADWWTERTELHVGEYVATGGQLSFQTEP